MWNASHLAVRLCALRHWKRVSIPPTTQSLRHPLTRAIHFAPRLFFMFLFQSPSIFPLNPKTDRLQRKTNIQKLDYLYYPDFG